jgi:hypothetical protein
MKNKGFVILFSLMAFLLFVSLACGFSIGNTPAAPTPVPPTRQSQPTQPIQKPTEAPSTQVVSNPTADQGNTSGGLKTFTDQNNFYQIQVPGDWVYKQVTGDNYYIDQFTSPDEQALVENIAYDDGTPFTGRDNGKFALDLLNRFYSNTGAVGDIRVLGDQLQPDGSERLEWISKSGGYSGYSYFEIRDKTTFLMITIDWVDSAKDVYLDTLNAIIESYSLP